MRLENVYDKEREGKYPTHGTREKRVPFTEDWG